MAEGADYGGYVYELCPPEGSYGIEDYSTASIIEDYYYTLASDASVVEASDEGGSSPTSGVHALSLGLGELVSFSGLILSGDAAAISRVSSSSFASGTSSDTTSASDGAHTNTLGEGAGGAAIPLYRAFLREKELDSAAVGGASGGSNIYDSPSGLARCTTTTTPATPTTSDDADVNPAHARSLDLPIRSRLGGPSAAVNSAMGADADAVEGVYATTDSSHGGWDASDPNWNERFQRLLEMPTVTPQQEERRAIGIKRMCRAFVDAASRAGRDIIADRSLPVEERRIKPADGMGGVAGGEKYVHGGIFFKFALDWKGMYGGHGNAMKSAAKELSGLIAVAGAGIPGLCVPLTCLVEFRGWRLFAAAMLPVGPGDATLRYGSSDAAKTIKKTSPYVNGLMRSLGHHLNLASHPVGRGDQRTHLCGPADLEVHVGRDRRVYCLDTARLMPPSALCLAKEGLVRPSAHLYDQLRVEFVVTYSEAALSSDAYTGFGACGAETYNRDVTRATHFLRTVVVPATAQALTEKYIGTF